MRKIALAMISLLMMGCASDQREKVQTVQVSATSTAVAINETASPFMLTPTIVPPTKPPVQPSATSVPPFDSNIIDALLLQDWISVANGIESNPELLEEPVYRLLLAHAQLANNQNNASMLLFLATINPEDLGAWEEWTNVLSDRHANQPVPLFLAADAQARVGHYEEALNLLEETVLLEPTFALAWNARGVILTLTDRWDEGLTDLLQATAQSTELADSFANLGTYWILREVPSGAIDAFSRAIEINPTFALAYNGRGVAYFGQGDFEQAAINFRIASQLSPELSVAVLNEGYAYSYALDLTHLVSHHAETGTSIGTIIEPVSMSEIQPLRDFGAINPGLLQQMETLALHPDHEQANIIANMTDTYGIAAVQQAYAFRIQELEGLRDNSIQLANDLFTESSSASGALATSQTIQNATSTALSIISFNQGIEQAGSLISYMSNADNRMQFIQDRITDFASENIDSRTLSVILDGFPFEPKNHVALANNILNSGFNIYGPILTDQIQSLNAPLLTARSEAVYYGVQARALTESFPYSYSFFQEPTILASPLDTIPSLASVPDIFQVTGVYLPPDSQYTDIGFLAPSLYSQILPIQTSEDIVTVVADDPFRANLLQHQLSIQGIGSIVVPPEIDTQSVIDQVRSERIVSIQTLSPPSLSQTQLLNPLVPGSGNAAGGGGNPPPIVAPPRELDWKPFLPNLATQGPGGISTEELAQAYVDQGDWPVMNHFGLLYLFVNIEETNQ